MYKRIEVALNRRAFLLVDKRPVRYLATGRHIVIRRPFTRYEVEWYSAEALDPNLSAEHLKLVPSDELRTFTVAPHERALVRRRGRPFAWLGAGEHQVWTVERLRRRLSGGLDEVVSAFEVEIVDTSAVAVKPLREEVRALVSDREYVEVTAPSGTVALRCVDGAIDEVLAAGRHAAWTTTRKVTLSVVDLRQRVLAVSGQEVMTKDRVSLRLNLSAVFRVADPLRLATVARDADAELYLAMQLAAREVVATRTLDELLAERDLLGGVILEGVSERAAVLGLQLEGFGLKDVILPGDMKALLNRVTEAQKVAEANVILRREEAAATRSQAQTAKVLADNPLLVRLKELEAYKEIAARVEKVHVVVGDGAVPRLTLKGS